MAQSLSAFSTNVNLYGRELLSQLQKNLAFATKVTKKFSPTSVGRGGILNVPKLSDTVAQTRSIDGGAVTPTDMTLTAIPVTLDTPLVSLKRVDSIDKILSNIDVIMQSAKRDAYTLAEAIEAKLAGLWVDIPYYVGSSSALLFADTTAARDAVKLLRKNKAPKSAPIYGVISVDSADSASGNANFTTWNAAGQAGADLLVSGELGRRYGINWDYGQAVVAGSANGGATVWGTPLVNNGAGYAIGATQMAIDGLASSGTIKKGDAFKTAAGSYYVVTADATVTSNATTIHFSPALAEALADDDPLTVGAGVVSATQNLIFQDEAFALALAPVDDERPNGESMLITDDQTGMSVRLFHTYDITTFSHLFSAEMLCGVKTVRPELAVRAISSL